MDNEYFSLGAGHHASAEARALLFTQAIHDGLPTAALYAERARVFIGTSNLVAAADDASMAAELDPTMPRAYLRRARACIGLERYVSALAAVLAGTALAPGDVRFAELMDELDGKTTTMSSQARAQGNTDDNGQLRTVIDDVLQRGPRPAHRRASSSLL